MVQKSNYTYDELIQCANGQTFGEGNARLPLPNMLMMDRVVEINEKGGRYNAGEIIAELDINPSLWFFDCHFQKDPVMPGCLGLDAMWQILGFHLAWLGHKGRGRALGVGDVRFQGQILPENKKVTYHIHIKRVVARSLVMGVADGELFLDDEKEPIYKMTALKTGLFV